MQRMLTCTALLLAAGTALENQMLADDCRINPVRSCKLPGGAIVWNPHQHPSLGFDPLGVEPVVYYSPTISPIPGRPFVSDRILWDRLNEIFRVREAPLE